MNTNDYIKPGEFRYCSQGLHLQIDPSGLCPSCLPNEKLEKKWGDIANAILYEIRANLAVKRQKEGLKPLFWMQK
jgi:hypothetical protein